MAKRRVQIESELKHLQKDISVFSDRISHNDSTDPSGSIIFPLNESRTQLNQNSVRMEDKDTTVVYKTTDVERLYYELHVAKRERDESTYKFEQCKQEVIALRIAVQDFQRMQVAYEHLNQDHESLRLSLESSERIRKQQKDLIYLLQRSQNITLTASVENRGAGGSENSCDNSTKNINSIVKLPVRKANSSLLKKRAPLTDNKSHRDLTRKPIAAKVKSTTERSTAGNNTNPQSVRVPSMEHFVEKGSYPESIQANLIRNEVESKYQSLSTTMPVSRNKPYDELPQQLKENVIAHPNVSTGRQLQSFASTANPEHIHVPQLYTNHLNYESIPYINSFNHSGMKTTSQSVNTISKSLSTQPSRAKSVAAQVKPIVATTGSFRRNGNSMKERTVTKISKRRSLSQDGKVTPAQRALTTKDTSTKGIPAYVDYLRSNADNSSALSQRCDSPYSRAHSIDGRPPRPPNRSSVSLSYTDDENQSPHQHIEGNTVYELSHETSKLFYRPYSSPMNTFSISERI